MKRVTVLILMLLVLTACGGKSTAVKGTTGNQGSVAQLMENAAQDTSPEPALPSAAVSSPAPAPVEDVAPASPAEDGAPEQTEEPAPDTDGIDVDLTRMNATMVFAEVSNIMYMPYEYLGKIIRMKGTAVSSADPDTGIVYHAVIIQDATACCASGLEYVLAEGEYPPDEAEVTVTGEFGLYEENDMLYCQLTDAVLSA